MILVLKIYKSQRQNVNFARTYYMYVTISAGSKPTNNNKISIIINENTVTFKNTFLNAINNV